jgi:hypothetical protein
LFCFVAEAQLVLLLLFNDAHRVRGEFIFASLLSPVES